jgi:hypothetical protein
MAAVFCTAILLISSPLLGVTILEPDTWTPPALWLYLTLAVEILLSLWLLYTWLIQGFSPPPHANRGMQLRSPPSVWRPRMTGLRWLVLLAVVCSLFVVSIPLLRTAEYRSRAEAHARHLRSARSLLYEPPGLRDWHRRMQKKYERAALRPWLPVASDPPEPE